ncbi:MAG TPA: diguanylate cyclase [Nostocaceae cyanobacterium]|nr:diguanylate cyclase [Nostocaceae cyanobacterium]
MKISILIFGSNDFLAMLPDQIRDATAFSVEVITNLDQAKSHVPMTPPDVIFVQANLDGSLELCCWLKEQTKLSWIYCILFEDRPQQLAQRQQKGWEWELKMATIALEQGADAYIWQISQETDVETKSTANHQLILAQIAAGLRKVQKYRELIQTNDLLSAIALADSLTELNNRRALEWDLPRQINRAKTLGTPLSLMILDVDYFKKVNDTYGHLVGDRLLQLLSERLRKNLRVLDTPFRYGGEEFVVILAETSSEEALIVAHRLNRVVGEETFVIDHKLSIRITISIGIASLETNDDEHGTALLYRADQCLLEAKATGRDKVVSWDYLQPSHLRAVSG